MDLSDPKIKNAASLFKTKVLALKEQSNEDNHHQLIFLLKYEVDHLEEVQTYMTKNNKLWLDVMFNKLTKKINFSSQNLNSQQSSGCGTLTPN